MSKGRSQQQQGDMVGTVRQLRPCDRLQVSTNIVFVSPDAGQVQVHPSESLSALDPHWPTVIGLVPSATVRMSGNDVASHPFRPLLSSLGFCNAPETGNGWAHHSCSLCFEVQCSPIIC